jgi:hypothetical protein
MKYFQGIGVKSDNERFRQSLLCEASKVLPSTSGEQVICIATKCIA